MTPAERYEEAFRAQCLNSIREYEARIDHETPEFLRINSATWAAAAACPWWRRWLIDGRVLRDLDYWERMRGSFG